MTVAEVRIGTRSGVADPAVVAGALRAQRDRLCTIARDFTDEEWVAATRCREWTVHQVLRHLVDPTGRICKAMRGEPTGDREFDPNTTPKVWLAETASLRPAGTPDALADTTAAEADTIDALASVSSEQTVPGPYGPLHWSTLALHMFWDSWLHERDVVLPLGREHDSAPGEDRLAAAYGIAIACVPLLMIGERLAAVFALSGPGGGVFTFDVDDELTVVARDGDSAETGVLRGELRDVVDLLGGRGSDPSVLQAPHDVLVKLSYLSAFMRG